MLAVQHCRSTHLAYQNTEAVHAVDDLTLLQKVLKLHCVHIRWRSYVLHACRQNAHHATLPLDAFPIMLEVCSIFFDVPHISCSVDWSPTLERYSSTAEVKSENGRTLFKGFAAQVRPGCLQPQWGLQCNSAWLAHTTVLLMANNKLSMSHNIVMHPLPMSHNIVMHSLLLTRCCASGTMVFSTIVHWQRISTPIGYTARASSHVITLAGGLE